MKVEQRPTAEPEAVLGPKPVAIGVDVYTLGHSGYVSGPYGFALVLDDEVEACIPEGAAVLDQEQRSVLCGLGTEEDSRAAVG